MATNDKHPDLPTAALELVVELLAARDRANAIRDEIGPWVRKYADPLGVWSGLLEGTTVTDVRNLAYDVASIHVRALTELTKQSEEFSRKIVSRLKETKRPQPRHHRSDADHLLVCTLAFHASPDGPCYRGEFLAPARIERLPQALVLRPLEGGAEFPVAARFPRDAREGDVVHVTVPADPWIEKGKHYQARLPLAGADAVVCFKLVGSDGQ